MLKKYFTKLVEEFPSKPHEGVIYYNDDKLRSMHLCPCDCGEEVWLSHYSHGWKAFFDKKGELSIVTPIENKKCQTIYTIRQGYSFDERVI